MKTLLLTLSFLLFTFTTQADVVFDTNGNPLLPGVGYLILPVIWGPTGGGLFPGKAGNSTYPVNVLKSFSEVDFGKPLRFLPLTRIYIIPTDTYLNIQFVDTPDGVSSGNWITVRDLGETWTIGIGGSQDHEGFETLEGLFKINKSGLGYKLSFLPYVNGPMSGDIGTYIDDDDIRDRKWRLVITDEQAYEVVFSKVEVESS